MADTTTIADVVRSFHTHPLARKALPDGLETAFFESALAYYELEIGDLNYDEDTQTFDSQLSRITIYALGMRMYVEYITRELSRIEKLNGFHGKDIQLTGNDESKRTTRADLEIELERCDIIMHKLKQHGLN